jgi:hypothetical protein
MDEQHTVSSSVEVFSAYAPAERKVQEKLLIPMIHVKFPPFRSKSVPP